MKRVKINELPNLSLSPIDSATLAQSKAILDEVKENGLAAVISFGKKFKELASDEIVVTKDELSEAFKSLPVEDQNLLTRTARRIHTFAAHQLASMKSFSTNLSESGSMKAGQSVIPVETAGCYAPGGRYPLPSSVLMTVVTAKVAGVRDIVLASPKCGQNNVTMAAAYAALTSTPDSEYTQQEVNLTVLTVGGPHAIAAMAYGVESLVPKCDVIVGPGNKWVTAAKQLVSNVECRIDMLAGPSECLVMADESSIGHEEVIAADLLAQAEHDTDALPILLSTSDTVIENVHKQIEEQLKTLSTAEVASVSVSKGLSVKCDSLKEMITVSEKLAPEHLELFLDEAVLRDTKEKLKNYGGLFVGKKSAEVFGDYGLGPNHTLPTSGTGRYIGGLSVFNFLKVNTWLEIDQLDKGVIDDCARLARLEGLEGHARAAEARSRYS